MSARALRIIAGLLASVAPSAALAQTASAPDSALPAQDSRAPATQAGTTETDRSAAIGDIVVTAQRREQRLQDVPVSVSVTTGEKIADLGIRDLQDLATRLPGIKLTSQVVSASLNIRGVGSGQNVGFEQSVGTFVDGVYRGRSRSSQAGLFDVERVEVLKGPQSTFFGNNTIAGALNITTKRPGSVPAYNATLSYAPTDHEHIGEAGLDIPITNGLSARVAGRAYGMNGYIYNNNAGRDEPRLRDLIGRVSLLFKPTDAFESYLRFDRVHNRDLGTFSAEVYGCPPSAAYGVARGACALYLAQRGGVIDNTLNFRSDVGPSGFRLDLSEVAWNNRYDFGPVTLSSLTSYYDQQSATYNQSQPLPVRGVGSAPSRSPFQEREWDSAFSQELRLESDTASPLQYVFGAYYARATVRASDYTGIFGVPAVGNAGAPITSAASPIVLNRTFHQTEDDRSAFGQLTARVMSSVTVAAGLRYTSVIKHANRAEFAGTTTAAIPGPDFTRVDFATETRLIAAGGASRSDYARPRTTFDRLLPSANVQIKLTPDINGYLSYAKGFKAGGYAVSANPFQFNSESNDSFELGVKGSLLNRALFFSLDGFTAKYRDLQEAIATISTSGIVISTVGNAARSTSKGIEASASYRASPFVSFNTEATYLRSRYQSYPNGQCTQLQLLVVGAVCVQNLSGKVRPFSPEFSATVGASLGAPLGNGVLRVEPSVYYSTGYYTSATIDGKRCSGPTLSRAG